MEIENMWTIQELNQRNIEEFTRLQTYILALNDDTCLTYQLMLNRYTELKVILESAGISLKKIDKIDK